MFNKNALSSKRQNWRTPKAKIFDPLDEVFDFDLDPCTTPSNPLRVKHFFTKKQDGLKQSWSFAKAVFVNSPYGHELPKWVIKCVEEGKRTMVVHLMPNHTEASYFHEYVFPNYRGLCFKRGRIHFSGKSGNTYGSCIAVYSPGPMDIAQMLLFKQLGQFYYRELVE